MRNDLILVIVAALALTLIGWQLMEPPAHHEPLSPHSFRGDIR